MRFRERLTKLFRNTTHRPERKPLTMECTYPLHGTQAVRRISDEVPAVLFLACGCFRTRTYPLFDESGIPFEDVLTCCDRDNALRWLFASAA